MITALDKEVFFLIEKKDNFWQTLQRTPIIEKPHPLATLSFNKEFFLKYWKTVKNKMSLEYFPIPMPSGRTQMGTYSQPG